MSREEVETTSSQPLPEGTRGSELSAAQHPEEGRRAMIRRLISFGGLGVITAAAINVLLFFQIGAWQMLAVMTGELLVIACLVRATRLIQRDKLDAAGYWTMFGVVLAFAAGELFHAGLTLYLAPGGLLLVLVVGTMVLPGRWKVWLAAAALLMLCIWLVNLLEPWPRFDVTSITSLRVFVPGLIAILALIALWLLVRTYRYAVTIRTRLLVSFVLLVLLPTVVVSVIVGVVGLQSGRQQAVIQLESVARIKQAEIGGWQDNLRSDLDSVLGAGQVRPRMTALLQTEDPSGSQVFWMRGHFQQVVEQTGRLDGLFLLDAQGRVVLATDTVREGQDDSGQDYFQEGLKDFYLQPPTYSSELDRHSMVTARPVIGPDRQALGVLVGVVDVGTLREIMGERAWLGDTGEVYLVDRDHILLTALRFDERREIPMHTEAADAAIETRDSSAVLYDDYRGESVIGVYHWMPELQVALLAKQDQSEALRSTNAMLRIIVAVGAGALGVAVFVSLFVTRSIARPLANLTESAVRIASGDLSRTVSMERTDEIGKLAQAFNTMAGQLQALIGSLERRVNERTRDLELRSAYLEASAEVGRAVASMLDTDRLVEEVVELIRARFGLYYVGLFLVDEMGEWAVLRAGTGEAGRQMLREGHKLAVGGQSMIGRCVAQGEAYIALDVGEEAVHFDNPLLPETHSEGALPLRSRGQVLGAITVQSMQPAAFDDDVITVLQTMADQVAVALDNARLFAESGEALEAERRAYGELSRGAWEELLRGRGEWGYQYMNQAVVPIEESPQSKTTAAAETRERAPSEGDGAVLSVPITVRDQAIGTLHFHKEGAERRWTDEEKQLLDALTEELGQALESARLYEDTQRRAARERLVSEVTARMRESLNVETVLKTTVDQMYQTLGLDEVVVRLIADEEDRERTR